MYEPKFITCIFMTIVKNINFKINFSNNILVLYIFLEIPFYIIIVIPYLYIYIYIYIYYHHKITFIVVYLLITKTML
jgi:hypothetical protein